MLTRIFNRRPYYIWQDAKSFFNLTDAELTAYFGPCPENPDK